MTNLPEILTYLWKLNKLRNRWTQYYFLLNTKMIIKSFLPCTHGWFIYDLFIRNCSAICSSQNEWAIKSVVNLWLFCTAAGKDRILWGKRWNWEQSGTVKAAECCHSHNNQFQKFAVENSESFRTHKRKHTIWDPDKQPKSPPKIEKFICLWLINCHAFEVKFSVKMSAY